ncbi:unnamed protein product [Ectocarpus sp. CCAP 1310/34]|nr:unnamed protein product [Ectocarpus sp. CCAP 1310/34]
MIKSRLPGGTSKAACRVRSSGHVRLRSSSDESNSEGEPWGWSADQSGREGDDRGGAGGPWDDSSQDKWEALYAEGEKEKQSSTFLSAMADWGKGGVLGAVDVEYTQPVEVVSFDLDDTLWPTMTVISQANAALQEHLSREHPDLAEKYVIADLMKEIWKEKLVKNPELDPAPVNLTGLRKAGLARACELAGIADPTPVVESCFEVWRRARHDVERHLFPGVLDTLRELKGRGVRLVAITNGNAQTDDIPCLKDLFEFCVLAEQVGERKPQPGPFRAAVKKAGYPSEFAVGGEWVHVGDDWASDCVGGKKMRMRTVLVRVPGKPAVGSGPDEAEEEKDVDGEEEDNTLDGMGIDDVDDDDDFPTLEDGTMPPDESPEGKAQRRRLEQEKARRRAEKLGILLDSDFEMAAGTAAANSGDGKTVKSSSASRAGDAASPPREEEGERNREQRRREEEEEEEKKAREELKNRKLYAREMSAIAMGHPEVAQGPGKMMSMGSSSYVIDMLMNDFMDASLDNIAELVGLVDQWNNKIPVPGPDGQDDAAAAAAVAAIEAGRGGGGAGGRGSPVSIGSSRRSGGEKFCTECGAKIPASAKFCSECGAKQEETVPAA